MKKHKLVIQRRSAFNAIIILIIVASHLGGFYVVFLNKRSYRGI